MHNTKHVRRMVLVLFLLVAGIVVIGSGGKTLSLTDLPEKVQATIKEHAQNGTIEEIELETENGKSIYEIEVLKDSKEFEFKVAEDGVFLGMEDEDEEEDDDDSENESRKISLQDAPEAVKAAILKIAGSNPVKEIEVEYEDGFAEYEAEYLVDNVEHSVVCSETGDIMELERKVDPNTMPKAALATISKKFPGAEIKEAEAVQSFYFEVELVKNGKKMELTVSANGCIDEDDDAVNENEDEEDDD